MLPVTTDKPDARGVDASKGDEIRLDEAPDAGETITDYFAFEEVFRRVLATADHELDASSKFLFWSGLGAGLALGLTFIARIVFTEASGEPAPALLGNLFYPVGFIIIVIGRYQLFTENTLTPVVLVLTKLASLRILLRLWGVVLAANMIGAFAVSTLLVYADILDDKQVAIAIEVSQHAVETPVFTLLSKSLISGWIVAAMVWLVHGCRETLAKIVIVWALMYFIGVGKFFHVVTSSVEAFYLVLHGEAAFWPALFGFTLPVLIGNIVGGILFVAVLNTAQFGERNVEAHEDLVRYGNRLTWREWIFGRSKTFGSEDAPVR